MCERLVVEIKKLSHDYKKKRTSYANDLFLRALQRPHPRMKKITFNMINNWMYGKNENAFLDEVFFEMMLEADPDGVEADIASHAIKE